jgi:fatty acid desaturase
MGSLKWPLLGLIASLAIGVAFAPETIRLIAALWLGQVIGGCLALVMADAVHERRQKGEN